MSRFSFPLFCSVALSVQILVIAGCGGSTTRSTTGGGGGNNPSPASSAECGGQGFGYNNANGIGVWLQSPLPGANPGHVQVSATESGSPVAKWTVCLDGKAVYQANSTSTTISQGVDIPDGQHLLWAAASDATGKLNRSEIHLIQVGPATPGSTVLPTPPANAQVVSQMQNDTAKWGVCSLCAAGTNTTGNYWMHFAQSQPSLSGSSLEMYADGASWTNVLFMDTMLGTSSNSHFLWDFWVYHDPAAESHFWSSEFDLWQVLGGKEFMIGSQCDYGDGYWSTWDSQDGSWILNGIPCPHWSAGWHHVQWYVERLNATQYRYDTLVLDGQGYGLNQTWNVNDTAWQDMIGVQFQLDQDTTGTPLHEWVDKVTLTMW